jgi:hypothetical protein
MDPEIKKEILDAINKFEFGGSSSETFADLHSSDSPIPNSNPNLPTANTVRENIFEKIITPQLLERQEEFQRSQEFKKNFEERKKQLPQPPKPRSKPGEGTPLKLALGDQARLAIDFLGYMATYDYPGAEILKIGDYRGRKKYNPLIRPPKIRAYCISQRYSPVIHSIPIYLCEDNTLRKLDYKYKYLINLNKNSVSLGDWKYHYTEHESSYGMRRVQTSDPPYYEDVSLEERLTAIALENSYYLE